MPRLRCLFRRSWQKFALARNRLAHGYATVDVERIWNEVPAGAAALETFTDAIAAGLSRQA